MNSKRYLHLKSSATANRFSHLLRRPNSGPLSKSIFSSNSGFTIVELLVASGAMIFMMLALGAISSDVVRGRNSAEQSADYLQLINVAQRELMEAASCEVLGGEFSYSGNAEVALPAINEFNKQGQQIRSYPVNNNVFIPGTRIKLTGVFVEPAAAGATAPITLTVDNLAQPFDKIFTYIRVEASREPVGGSSRQALGGNALRPVRIPIMLFRQQSTGTIRYCGSNSVGSALCSQMGGAPLVVNTADGPVQKCDILPAYGGCARGGRFTRLNGGCSTTNPYTQDCNCPTGLNLENQPIEFAERKIADYQPSKNTRMEQYECLRCTENAVPPAEWRLPIPYDEDRLEMDIACGYSDISVYPEGSTERDAYLDMCPCAPPNDTAMQCQCYNDPTFAGCDNVCNYAPDSCDCKEQQYLQYAPGTAEYQNALNIYEQDCYVPEETYYQ